MYITRTLLMCALSVAITKMMTTCPAIADTFSTGRLTYCKANMNFKTVI